MASILRQIVASPRARHPEAGLDLCYVTDNVIATSGPSSVWPKKAYRNPTDQLVKFLDYKHQEDWSIFEFRAEGTGYPDSEVYHRIHHFPWPDHHPPPFAVIPPLMASMRNWVQRTDENGSTDGVRPDNEKKRVAVVHCKAGKGRSGTAACSYLISEEGWKKEDALQRFTERRMRVGFGAGVSIPSQLRWVGYVDRWANKMSKKYVERAVEIVEIHVWGLRDGVKVTVEGYVEQGKRIEGFHIFSRQEKIIVDDAESAQSSRNHQAEWSQGNSGSDTPTLTSPRSPSASQQNVSNPPTTSNTTMSGQNVLLKPSLPIVLPTSDINIDFERRNKASYTGFTMVTSLAHVWFNAYFEGGHEGANSGVFEIEWDAMDGIKGSTRKGTRALDKLKVVWKYAETPGGEMQGKVITEPEKGEPVAEGEAADWTGESDEQKAAAASRSGGVTSGRAGGAVLTMVQTTLAGADSLGKELGLRQEHPNSADISRANSVDDKGKLPAKESSELKKAEGDESATERGVRVHGPEGQEYVTYDNDGNEEKKHVVGEKEGRDDTGIGRGMESGLRKVASIVSIFKGQKNGNGGKDSGLGTHRA